MQYTLPYGHEDRTFEIPSRVPCTIIQYHDAGFASDQQADRDKIRLSLAEPIGARPLHEIAQGKERVAIIISDGTRLCPSSVILPHVLDELARAGIPDSGVTIVTALGMHRKHTEDELRRLTGTGVFDQYRVINHSPLPDDCVRLGVTSLGTPVEILREAAEADLRIAIGNIEPHGLVGVSGGVKAVFPGIASQRAIESHHALSMKYPPHPGDLHHPLRADIEEMLSFIPLHYIVNVIVNHRGHILSAYSGDPIAAHRAGAEEARKAFMVGKQPSHDIVIASTGGYPKDIQLYQAVKTLQNASEVCADGGSIVLLARCQELFGNGVFQYWVETIQDRERIVQMLNRQFVLGAHKISYIDQILRKHKVYLYSDIPAPLAELIGFEAAGDLQIILDSLYHTQPHASTAILPYGGLTFPYKL